MGNCNCARDKKDQMMLDRNMGNPRKRAVYLNVYDLLTTNHVSSKVGVGVYHIGVEVDEQEYSFNGHLQTSTTGLSIGQPRDGSRVEGAVFKETIHAGYTRLTQEEIQVCFDAMHTEYEGPRYNVLGRNCIHFASDFMKRIMRPDDTFKLHNESPIPAYVTRVARAANKCRGCMPAVLTSDLRELAAPADTKK
jgi:hypothetical protein